MCCHTFVRAKAARCCSRKQTAAQQSADVSVVAAPQAETLSSPLPLIVRLHPHLNHPRQLRVHAAPPQQAQLSVAHFRIFHLDSPSPDNWIGPVLDRRPQSHRTTPKHPLPKVTDPKATLCFTLGLPRFSGLFVLQAPLLLRPPNLPHVGSLPGFSYSFFLPPPISCNHTPSLTDP